MKIPVKNIIKTVTNPNTIGATAFVGVGLYKMCKDYRNSEQKDRKKILLLDAAIITGSSLAFMTIKPLTSRLCRTNIVKHIANGIDILNTKIKKSNFYQNKLSSFFQRIGEFTKKPQQAVMSSLEKTERLVKDCVAGVLNTSAGILGAVYTDAFIEKYILKENHPKRVALDLQKKEEVVVSETDDKIEQVEKLLYSENSNGFFHKSKVFKTFDYSKITAKDTAHRFITTIYDLPINELRILEQPMVALTGFSVAEVDGSHNKLKKASYELLASSLIPTFFVSLTSIFTERCKPIIKYPALVLSLVVGAISGSKVANKYKPVINEKIDKINTKYLALK